MKRILFAAAGFTSLSAGIVGIFLPILPTTPFFLLAGACFLRSSDRLYLWLTSHPVYGPYITNYLKYRSVTLRSKVIGIAVLWAVMLSTILFAVDLWWVRIMLAGIACAVTIHLVLLKTLTKEMLEADRNS